jgi:hypothetical protein
LGILKNALAFGFINKACNHNVLRLATFLGPIGLDGLQIDQRFEIRMNAHDHQRQGNTDHQRRSIQIIKTPSFGYFFYFQRRIFGTKIHVHINQYIIIEGII